MNSRSVRHLPEKIPRRAASFSTGSRPGWLTLVLLSACSSAVPPGEDYQGSSGDEGPLSGGSSSSTSTSTSTTGSGSGAGASTSQAEDDTGTTGSSDDVPVSEPVPQDEPESKNLPMDVSCDPGTALSWRLALRDGLAMSGAAQAREAMLGPWPQLASVALAPWEFLNYYSFPYPAASSGTLMPAAQLRLGEDALGDMYELQLAVRGPALAPGDRPPLHLTLALDNSGSMAGKGLDLLQVAGHALASQLRAGDSVAIATWDAKKPVQLPLTSVSGPDDPVLLAALMQFELGGGASLADGLTSASDLASKAYVPEDINRLVVITDGISAVTPDDLAAVAKLSADKPGKPGVHVIGLGVGEAAQYRDDLIHALASAGGGPALFIGSEAEAQRQLEDRFLNVVGLAATDVQVRLFLPPGLQVWQEGAEGLAAEYERVLVAPNDNVILHRTLRACVDDLQPSSALGVELSWLDPMTGEAKKASAEWSFGELLAGDTAFLAKGTALLAYVDALAAAQAETLDKVTMNAALQQLAEAQLLLPQDGELAEIADVLAVLEQP